VIIPSWFNADAKRAAFLSNLRSGRNGMTLQRNPAIWAFASHSAKEYDGIIQIQWAFNEV
jgi:hypothetical protein